VDIGGQNYYNECSDMEKWFDFWLAPGSKGGGDKLSGNFHLETRGPIQINRWGKSSASMAAPSQ
jgi:hypothetical protein